MANNKTDCKGSQLASIAAASAKSATPRTTLKKQVKKKSDGSRIQISQQEREFLEHLRDTARRLRDPKEMERFQAQLESLQNRIPDELAAMPIRGQDSVIEQMGIPRASNNVHEMLDDIASTAAGSLGGVGRLVQSGTMEVATGLASGKVETSGELAVGILGDTSQSLSGEMASQYSEILQPSSRAGVGASASASVSSTGKVTISVKVDTSKIAAASARSANGAMQSCRSAMNKGIAKIKSLTSIVGKFNGAKDLLTASIQKALDQQVAKMMAKIMTKVNTAHGITHPMFLALFKMTWSENKQWKPNWGETCAKFLEPVKELIEYFDFVQKVMGGAINIVCKTCDKLFTDVVNAATGLLTGASAGITVKFPIPNLAVPLMSISKQVADLMKKLQVIKEIIRQKARMILEKLKSLSAPDLFIKMPSEFFVILEVLVEAEFIYANLHIVIDKIIEFFINLLVQKFAKIANSIISKILAVWKKVVKIVPPLQDLIKLCWAVPNTADCCFNVALNIALPEVWSIIQPYVMMPFECIDMISKACDEATKLAYAIPKP